MATDNTPTPLRKLSQQEIADITDLLYLFQKYITNHQSISVPQM
jgi:hypothetical protein